MILINNKSFKELCHDTEIKLKEEGFSVTPGSIAKLFADIINKNISEYYATLTVNHMQSFVTTASGDFLDAIGILLDCDRIDGESDSDYRKRITHQCLSLAKANYTAIRLAVLSVPGVEDVAIRRYAHGPGSFSVVPIINTSFNIDNVIESVRYAIDDVCSYGEKITIKVPDKKYIKITVNLAFSATSTDVNRQSISVSVREEILKYISSLKLGETLIINELTQRIMQTHDDIVNYSCTNFKINNQNCLYINQSSRWDEKFAISPDANSIIVA